MGLSQNRRRLIGRLRIRRQREREGSVLVEGMRAVNDALDAGADATFAVVAPALLANSVATDLVSQLRSCCDTIEVAALEDDGILQKGQKTSSYGGTVAASSLA